MDIMRFPTNMKWRTYGAPLATARSKPEPRQAAAQPDPQWAAACRCASGQLGQIYVPVLKRILRTKTVARGGREGAVWAPSHSILREFCALRPWRAAAARAPFGRVCICTGAQWGEKGACHFGGWKSHGKGQILLF